jgi:MinD-like ATPase involved in chromosome partitioning or flagellar assembly
MTRIITITSGLERTGKTQLGINAALDLARKGHTVGYYHEGGGSLPINQLLRLPQHSLPNHPGTRGGVLRRGYQGVDIVSSRISLSNWGGLDAEQLAALLAAHEVWSDYDDFLIDTSGMSPHGVVSCCNSSPLVVLVVTPEPQSQAEAFGLLKILHLNAFDNQVLLVVNRTDARTDVNDIHAHLADMAREHLGMVIPLLGSVAEDEQVQSAQQLRQAFTSIYPESTVARQVVELVVTLDALQPGTIRSRPVLPAFWKAVADAMRKPVHLAGNTDLVEYPHPDEFSDSGTRDEGEHQRSEATTLLRFEGPLARLDRVLAGFSGVIQVIADDLQSFHQRIVELNTGQDRPGEWPLTDARVLELTLATILKILRDSINYQEQVCFEVEEYRVDSTDSDWLRAGHYIKYVFLVPGQGNAIDLIGEELQRIPDLRRSMGEEGTCICEALSAAREACLSVINNPQGEIRVNYWHQPETRTSVQPENTARDGAAGRGMARYPANGRLH